jgi:hypothetical protein
MGTEPRLGLGQRLLQDTVTNTNTHTLTLTHTEKITHTKTVVWLLGARRRHTEKEHRTAKKLGQILRIIGRAELICIE